MHRSLRTIMVAAVAAACHGATLESFPFDNAYFANGVLKEGSYSASHTGNGGKSYLVTSPVRAGSKALRVYLGANTGDKSREEWYLGPGWTPGQVRTLKFSVMVPTDFKTPQNHCILSQVLFQTSVGPPPIMLGVNGGNFSVILHSDPDDTYRRVKQWDTPIPKGQWVDFVFEAKHSAGADGYLKVWLNGSPWITYSGRTVKLPTGTGTTRIGIYRGADANGHNVFFDSVLLTDAPYSGGGSTPPGEPANQAPTISAIANQTTTVGVARSASFTVGDDQTAVGSLTLSGASSNTTLLPLSGIAFSGTGTSRTVTLTPAAGKTGTATVTVTVRDGGGLTANRSFTLTVNAEPTGGTTGEVACAADAFVRDGSSASGNNGGATELMVKADASGYNRESYLRFALDPAAAVDAAVLELTVTGAGSLAASTDFAVELIAGDAWSESTLTWNNRPTATIGSAVLVKGAAVGATVRVDVTNHVRETLANDPSGVLTLRIRGTTAGSQRWVTFASREAASGRPALALTLVGGAG